MPYRMLCNDVQREGVKFSPDLTSGLLCYVPLYKIWYGIRFLYRVDDQGKRRVSE